jgi:replication fork clamp-binding protein CrfC
MPDIFNLNSEMQSYFNSLPTNIQETIIQSGAKVNSLADMKAVVKNLTDHINQVDGYEQ